MLIQKLQNQNYVDNTGRESKKITGRRVFFSVVCSKIHIFGCPGNTRCNAILKKILSLTKTKSQDIRWICTNRTKTSHHPYQRRADELYPMRHLTWVQSCCITSTLPRQTNQAPLSYTHENHRVKNKREAMESGTASRMLVRPD